MPLVTKYGSDNLTSMAQMTTNNNASVGWDGNWDFKAMKM